MPTLLYGTPKYRLHRPSGQAVVTIRGTDHYLGPWKSKASLVVYHRLISEWLAEVLGHFYEAPTNPSKAPSSISMRANPDLSDSVEEPVVELRKRKSRRPD